MHRVESSNNMDNREFVKVKQRNPILVGGYQRNKLASLEAPKC